MEGDHGRGQRRGRARRVRQAGPRHHARPAEEREDGQRARGPAPGRPRVPRQIHPRHGPGRADLPRPARRPAGGLRPARPDVPGDGPVLQRGRHRPARQQAGPARGGAAGPGIAGGVSRPADDQLPGLPRAQRPPVRRVRQGDRRRPALPAAGDPPADPAVRPARNRPDAEERPDGTRAHGEQRGHGDVLEPRRGPVGPGPGGALPAPAGAGHGAGPAPAGRRSGLPLDRGRPPARPG